MFCIRIYSKHGSASTIALLAMPVMPRQQQQNEHYQHLADKNTNNAATNNNPAWSSDEQGI
jgi:hypothetical protein